MKKQLILEEVKLIIDEDSSEKDILQTFLKFLLKECAKWLVCFLSFFLLALLLIDNINKLAIISPNIYLVFTGVFAVFSFLCFAVLMIFYLCKERFNRQKAKVLYYFYQTFDIFIFIFQMLAVLYFIIMFVLTPAKVSGDSMEDTYHDGDNILVWHLFYEPELDDVVIIDTEDGKYKTQEKTNFIIKRIVAIAGSKINYVDGYFVVDGQQVQAMQKTDYQKMFIDSKTGDSYYQEGEIVLPEGYLIVLGDNRNNSYDSTEFGLVDCDDVLGKSIIRLYPKSGLPEKKLK